MAFDSPKRRRFVMYLKKKKKNETTSFYLLQRQNDVVSPGSNAQIEEPIPRSSLQRGGGGGKTGERAWLAAARLDFNLT